MFVKMNNSTTINWTKIPFGIGKSAVYTGMCRLWSGTNKRAVCVRMNLDVGVIFLKRVPLEV